jgi:hypothetical protein
MKKKLFLICVAGLLTVNAFADHPSGRLGLGIFGGGGSASAAGGHGSLGVTLKLPVLPIFWGVTAYFGDPLALSASADYYLIDADLVQDGSFNLDWFLAIGAFGHFTFGSDNFSAALGARLPIGLSWHISNNFELFADVVPGIGISFRGSPLYWVWGGEFGLRVWI